MSINFNLNLSTFWYQLIKYIEDNLEDSLVTKYKYDQNKLAEIIALIELSPLELNINEVISIVLKIYNGRENYNENHNDKNIEVLRFFVKKCKNDINAYPMNSSYCLNALKIN